MYLKINHQKSGCDSKSLPVSYGAVRWVICLVALLAGPVSAATGLVGQALDLETKVQQSSADSQKQVDELDDEARRLLDEYRRVSAELDELKTWNERTGRTVDAQREHIARLEREVSAAEVTRREIEPLMDRMERVLGEFVERDLPFLPDERQERLDRLAVLSESPETGVAERFRGILEAYQIEAGFGQGIEVYRDRLDDGSERLVDFLRLGRVALYYRTLDGAEAGGRTAADESWRRLTPPQAEALGHALRVGRKELPPDLLALPVPASKGAE